MAKKQKPTEEVDWLLFERRENEPKAYLCDGFEGSSLEELVKVARGRRPGSSSACSRRRARSSGSRS